MPNTKYRAGARLEREVVNAFRAGGWHALRSAGSHSPMDVVVWRGRHTNETKCVVYILGKLGFERVGSTYVRQRRTGTDVLFFNSFNLADPQDEYVMMFQCKRRGK